MSYLKIDEPYREGTKVLAWGKELYVYEIRENGYWLTESMDSNVGWYADYYDITKVLEEDEYE